MRYLQPLWPWPSAIVTPRNCVSCSRQLLPQFDACPQTIPWLGAKPFQIRPFHSSPTQSSWLIPKRRLVGKTRKGRPRMHTGGSTRGTTVVWGDYGIRMKDKDRRISAAQLELGFKAINQRLRGMRYRLFHRVAAVTPVYTSGNEVRMGKGKGSFDYWAARVSVSKIIFELKGDIHEQVIRDAFRLAGNKMPGIYEFVKKGDPPMMGLTKVQNEAHKAELMRPRRKPPMEETATRIDSSTP